MSASPETAEILAAQAVNGNIEAARILQDCLMELGDPRAELLRRRLSRFDREWQEIDALVGIHVSNHVANHTRAVNAYQRVSESYARAIAREREAEARYQAELKAYNQARAEFDAAASRREARIRERGLLGKVLDFLVNSSVGPKRFNRSAPVVPGRYWDGSSPPEMPLLKDFPVDSVRARYENDCVRRLSSYVFRLMRTPINATAVVGYASASAPVKWSS